MDEFDVPAIIPVRVHKEGPETGLNDSVQRARETLNKGLDALGRQLVRPATAWKLEADRRAAARSSDALNAVREANRAYRDALRDLRRDRKTVANARGAAPWWRLWDAEVWSARTVAWDTRQITREARQVRREARSYYPAPLAVTAARYHGVHCGLTFLWSAVSDSSLSATAATGSLLAVAANVAVVALGGRHVATDVADPELEALRPSQEERDLLQRLEPKMWHRVAEPRGLSDVLVADARLTESGIQVRLTLNGTMDVATLRGKESALRAALRLKEGTRLELREGKTGGHARLTLRTRSAADGLDMTGWKPGDAWAVNTVTGETVKVPLGKRMLIAGTSGSGKSWSARPLLAEASEWEDHRLVVFDRKYIEGRNWEHRARIATELDEMAALVDELAAEGEERLKLIPRGRDVIEISSTRPRITVFVDEGGELISDCKKEYERIIEVLRTAARKYRAAEIVLVWATQKPSLSGDGHGVDSQISGQLTDRLSLAVTTPTEARVVFGDDANESGWLSNKLPMPGYALLRQQELGPASVPQMLKMRAMSPAQVIALPDRPVWSRTVSSTGATTQDIEKRKRIEAPQPVRGRRKAGADWDDVLLEELHREPCRTMSDLSRATGASKSVVKKRLDQMASDGIVVRDEDGCWHPVI